MLVMLEDLLKELEEHNFEVLWKYNDVTNSIDIRLDKNTGHQRHSLVRKIPFDDFCHLANDQFEFNMVRFLKKNGSRTGVSN